LQKHLANKGVQTVVHYNTPIHLQPAAGSLGCRKGQFPVTERLCETILALPANQTLTPDDIVYVCASIRSVLAPRSSLWNGNSEEIAVRGPRRFALASR